VLKGTEGASYPFWSPDNKNLGFSADGKLKKIGVDGGGAETLALAPNARGGSWSARASCFFTERISSSQNAIASKAADEMEMSRSSQIRISSSCHEFKLTNLLSGLERKGCLRDATIWPAAGVFQGFVQSVQLVAKIAQFDFFRTELLLSFDFSGLILLFVAF
jgi:hypothetical protein